MKEIRKGQVKDMQWFSVACISLVAGETKGVTQRTSMSSDDEVQSIINPPLTISLALVSVLAG